VATDQLGAATTVHKNAAAMSDFKCRDDANKRIFRSLYIVANQLVLRFSFERHLANVNPIDLVPQITILETQV
jgi:hypothetical protein